MTLVIALFLAAAPQHPPVEAEVRDGVLLFRTADFEEIFVEGNSIAIVAKDELAVFDTGMNPGTARQVIAKLRRRVPKAKVRYVINSHWHWDHPTGNAVYQDAFPDVRIVAHEETRVDLSVRAGHLAFWNQELLPKRMAAVREKRAAAKDPKEVARWSQAVTDGEYFLREHAKARIVLPDVTFRESLTLHLGDRELRLIHLGRGNTAGDAMLHLPKERILITGDVVVHPIPYCFGVFPTEWIAVLRKVEAMDVDVIIPGHGPPLTDKEYVRDLIGVFEEAHKQLAASKAKGLSLEDATKALDLAAWREKFAKGDPTLANDFDESVVTALSKSIYQELDGPLPNRPPGVAR